MHHLEYKNSCLTLLTNEEILNPYIVLKEVFKESSSPVSLQDELYELLTLTMRSNYWMSYQSPLVLYKKYKKLLRLFEAGWLIQKIRPEYDLSERVSIPYKKIEVDKIKTQNFKFGSDPLTNMYQSLVEFYKLYPLSLLRGDLFRLLFNGLMPSCNNYTYELDGYLVKEVHKMSELIRVLHTIGRHEQNGTSSERDTDILTKERDVFYARESLYEYELYICNLYRYSKKEDVKEALAISKEILITGNFWRLHGNPANILHYFHDFQFVLDYYWYHYQFLIEIGAEINLKWQYPKDKKQELYGYGHKWIKKPWKFLHNQFKKNSIHKWHSMLDRLLEDVLSNQNLDIDHEHHEVLYFIESLLFMVEQDLEKYEPYMF